MFGSKFYIQNSKIDIIFSLHYIIITHKVTQTEHCGVTQL